MKYLEELSPGDLFVFQNKRFILTSNFKQKKNDAIHYEAISIIDGMPRWFIAASIVDLLDLYYRDKDGNILLLKEFKDEGDIFKNKDIS